MHDLKLCILVHRDASRCINNSSELELNGTVRYLEISTPNKNVKV